MHLRIFKPGTRIGMGNTVGRVVAVMIEANAKVSYRVVWWNGAERRCEWVEAVEVKSLPAGKRRIGFGRE